MTAVARKLPVVSPTPADALSETCAHEHFRCERLRCTLTRLGCAKRFARASIVRDRGKRAPRGWWALLDTCGYCPVGRAHQHRLHVYAPEQPTRPTTYQRVPRPYAFFPGPRTGWWRNYPQGGPEEGLSLLEAHYRGQALDVPVETGPATTPQGAFWLEEPDIPERCSRLPDTLLRHWAEYAEHVRQREQAARKVREEREARERAKRWARSLDGQRQAKHLAIQLAAKRQGLSLVAYLATRPATIEWLRLNPPPTDMVRENPMAFWLLILPGGDKNDEPT